MGESIVGCNSCQRTRALLLTGGARLAEEVWVTDLRFYCQLEISLPWRRMHECIVVQQVTSSMVSS